jgi:hypothetical protein
LHVIKPNLVAVSGLEASVLVNHGLEYITIVGIARKLDRLFEVEGHVFVGAFDNVPGNGVTPTAGKTSFGTNQPQFLANQSLQRFYDGPWRVHGLEGSIKKRFEWVFLEAAIVFASDIAHQQGRVV